MNRPGKFVAGLSIVLAATISSLPGVSFSQSLADPLPSWNDGPARQAIVAFVKATTTQGGPQFVPQPERIAAFGNSDGDRKLLEYTKGGTGARFAMLVLHDDARREFAYGPANGLADSKIGTFTQALCDQAKKQGWVVSSMKNDWKKVFAFD
jgi:hypothetical protein